MKTALINLIGRFSITAILRGAFIAGTIMTLIVSCVSLYAWQEQNKQIRYALGDYFPRMQASFLIEGQLNTLVNELNEFLKAPNTSTRLQLRNQITAHLAQIETFNQKLTGQDHQQIALIVTQSQDLLHRLDRALYALFLAREKVNTLSSRINWLHDDFNTELNSLSQDISLQQGSLLDKIEQDPRQAKGLQSRLRNVQGELQLIYTLARLEEQITNALTGRLNDIQGELAHEEPVDVGGYARYLQYLKSNLQANEPAFNLYPSSVTLRQTIDELLDIGLSDSQMLGVLQNYQTAQAELNVVTAEKDRILADFRSQLDLQLGSSHLQLQTLNHRLAKIMSWSGTTIIITAGLALLLALLLNVLFIRPRLVKRFTALNQAVARISIGDLTTTIPVEGRDELGRIAMLLQRSIDQINQQKRQLEQEIADRKAIEENLRTMQNELIQTAKLAVVGQTMTTLAHEINQPLNALSMHLFMAKKALPEHECDTALTALNKSEKLVKRMDGIVRSLRQFARKRDNNEQLQPICLRQCIQGAWDVLLLQHKTRKVALHYPEVLPNVFGDEIGIQQVLVNLLANALDASPTEAEITIDHSENGNILELTISDNGKGWPLHLADTLMKPFTTSKEIGLGVGLSISQSIMQQIGGELRIASTLAGHGCVILDFKKVPQNA
ncbi:two-component system sensor histidine kinase PgtB [Providencia rustigianii]|uniref:two-component system sensor histidine kinase PgtB n=1 Tax=Providencia rustigianii TaxID=158850 RepID=UPI000D86CA16|nr:ATP-binding protein [Providencia rustigianii]SPY76931.1 Phosphoglycerate transport system sensor protein pgtB [Providencia rustigianii]